MLKNWIWSWYLLSPSLQMLVVLRVVDKGRSLELIPLPPDGYTACASSQDIQAKIYIRPIQRNLSTEQVVSTGTLKTEKCIDCDETVPISKLRSHRDSCEGITAEGRQSPIIVDENTDSEEDLPSSDRPSDVLTTEDATEDAMVEYALTISADDEETQALSKSFGERCSQAAGEEFESRCV
ncbi:uncharacterized protein LOC135336255 [Halichondria panicea]|uniref:uncharacterized protein LOC135336255 n=1 Tax=Halichondria panicea TaxID=6063 RepID=UPI00312B4A0D